jgi:dGTPase
VALLGETATRRIDTLVRDLVESSQERGEIVQSDEIGRAMLSLRSFMFDHVYLGPHVRAEHERAHATIGRIFDALVERAEEPDRIIDFIAGMTDRFALDYATAL